MTVSLAPLFQPTGFTCHSSEYIPRHTRIIKTLHIWYCLSWFLLANTSDTVHLGWCWQSRFMYIHVNHIAIKPSKKRTHFTFNLSPPVRRMWQWMRGTRCFQYKHSWDRIQPPALLLQDTNPLFCPLISRDNEVESGLEPVTPQGPTIAGTGNGTPEVPELPSAWGYTWATLSSGGYKYGEIECWRGPAAN
jgi:hypothetical protein